MDKANACKQSQPNAAGPAVSDFLRTGMVERKIGRTTFVVSSRFNNEKEKDLVSMVARLVRNGGGVSDAANETILQNDDDTAG
jgi:hypothetical protein